MQTVLRQKVIQEEKLVNTYFEDRIMTCDFCNQEIPYNDAYYEIEMGVEGFFYGKQCCQSCIENEILSLIKNMSQDKDLVIYKHRSRYTKHDYTDYIMNKKEK